MWSYTPKQIAAYLQLARRRQARERAVELSIAALGARGDSKAVNKQIDAWEKGG